MNKNNINRNKDKNAKTPIDNPRDVSKYIETLLERKTNPNKYQSCSVKNKLKK